MNQTKDDALCSIIQNEISKLNGKSKNGNQDDSDSGSVEVFFNGYNNSDSESSSESNNSKRKINEIEFELSDCEDSDSDEVVEIDSSKDNSNQCIPPQNLDSIITVDSKSNISDSTNQSMGHTAGHDAFMTGYLFACYISIFGSMTKLPMTFSSQEIGLENDVNKVYLVGKSIPYLVRTGTFAKVSNGHSKKIQSLRTGYTKT